MSKEPKEFEVSKLLELTEKAKYAVTVAAFETVDKLEELDLPKKYSGKKASVRAMMALSEGIVTYDYIDDSRRKALEEELRSSRKDRYSLDAMFSTAPVADDSDEDLEEVVLTEPAEEYAEMQSDEDEEEIGDDSDDDSPSRRHSSDEDEELYDDFDDDDPSSDDEDSEDSGFDDDEDED